MNVWLFIHILGAVLFLGNIITAAFWKITADVRKDPAFIHHTVKNVMRADYIFTLPGLVMIIVSGNVMAVQAGYVLAGWNWLSLSIFLFALTGVIWLGLLIPLQRAMIRHSKPSVDSGRVSEAYKKVSLYWAVFGIAATLLPVVILYLMIVKSV